MKFVPRPYQKDAIRFLLDTPKAGLFLDVGLGKSACASVVMQQTLMSLEVRHWLIVAPLKVCQTTWTSEFVKWDHLQGITVNHLWNAGDAQVRRRMVRNKTDVTVINYDNLLWLIAFWGADWPYDGLVLDESSKVKDSSTKRFKKLRSVLPAIDRVVELTGSPVAQGFLGLWSQVYLLDHGKALGRTMTSYKATFFTSDYMGFKWTLRPGAQEKIEDSVRELCMTMRALDHLTLPPVMSNTIEVPLPPDKLEIYQKMESDSVITLKHSGEEITAMTAGVLANKLLQISNGAVYLPGEVKTGSRPYEVLHNEKLDALKDFVDEMAGTPFLLAYYFISDKDRLRKKFSEDVLEFFDGSAEQIERWQRKEIPVLAAHPMSSGHGVDGLQHATNIVVWLSPPWSRELYDQFNGRVTGARQIGTEFESSSAVIHHFVSRGTIDETIMAVLKQRGSTQEDFLNALRRRFA